MSLRQVQTQAGRFHDLKSPPGSLLHQPPVLQIRTWIRSSLLGDIFRLLYSGRGLYQNKEDDFTLIILRSLTNIFQIASLKVKRTC